MVQTRFGFTWNEAELARLKTPSGIAGQAAYRAAQKMRDRAKDNLKMDGSIVTGDLYRSIRIGQGATSGDIIRYNVGTLISYAKYVEEGRGPVVARPGKVLAFKPKGSATTIFRPRVGPAAGTHFLRRAMLAARASDFDR